MYDPHPVDVSEVVIPDDLEELIETLARNNHDIWAVERIREGWKLGPERNDEALTHPGLVPYEVLPEPEKEYDRKMAIGVLKVVLGLGYQIAKPG